MCNLFSGQTYRQTGKELQAPNGLKRYTIFLFILPKYFNNAPSPDGKNKVLFDKEFQDRQELFDHLSIERSNQTRKTCHTHDL